MSEIGNVKDILFICVLGSNLVVMIFTVLIPLVIGIFVKRNWLKKMINKDQNKTKKIDQEIKEYDLKIKKLQLENLQKAKKALEKK